MVECRYGGVKIVKSNFVLHYWVIMVKYGSGKTSRYLLVDEVFWHACKCQGYQKPLVDEFVMDIKEATSAVSDSTSPAGIILFSVS